MVVLVTVEGALGYLDEMDLGWWSLESGAGPFRLLEMGTRKVIQDHSTIGLVITSMGVLSSRANYVPAEEVIAGWSL